jgi:hypothetical protein
MYLEILYNIGESVIFLGIIALFLVATEIAFRIGRGALADVDDKARPQIGTLQAAALGLLALLLGFTFSMSIARFDVRKQLVLEEANAIGTTHLRAQLLPAPYGREAADLLERYVQVRLDFYNAGVDRTNLREAIRSTEALHRELWSRAVALATKYPRSIPVGLFVQSLNDTIDLHAKRVTALENHVPQSVFALLLLVAVLSMGLVGYGHGVGGRRIFLPTLIAAIVIASVIVLAADLDRPRRGLIKISQKSMLDLRDSLSTSAPGH